MQPLATGTTMVRGPRRHGREARRALMSSCPRHHRATARAVPAAGGIRRTQLATGAAMHSTCDGNGVRRHRRGGMHAGGVLRKALRHYGQGRATTEGVYALWYLMVSLRHAMKESGYLQIPPATARTTMMGEG